MKRGEWVSAAAGDEAEAVTFQRRGDDVRGRHALPAFDGNPPIIFIVLLVADHVLPGIE